MGELEDFFANLPENQDVDDGVTVTEAHVEKIFGTLEDLLLSLMTDTNVVNLTMTRAGKVEDVDVIVWSAVVRGVPLSCLTLTELVEALAKMDK